MMLCCAMSILAQNNRISYQAVVRDANNALVANKTVDVTVNIYNGPVTETPVYRESHTGVKTNFNGMISFEIGGGNYESGNWNAIDWKTATVTTKVTQGNEVLGTLEMPVTAVPYAIYADSAANVNSAAIAQQIHDTANVLRESIAITNANLETLGNRVNTFNTHVCDTVMNCDGIKTMRDSIQRNKQAIIDSTASVLGALTDTAIAIRGSFPPPPTNISAFVNDAGYITCDSSCITSLTTLVSTLTQQLSDLQGQFTALQEQIAESFPLPASVTTDTVKNIEATSATAIGTVGAGDAVAVTERGICWSTTQNPTIQGDHKKAAEAGAGQFTVNFDGLTANTTYYVRAYATNLAGTTYGNQVSFSTTTPPIVTTNAATNVTHAQATVGGKITSDGGATVMAYGICWSTNENPTTADNSEEVGQDMPENDYYYTITSGLDPGVTYHVRAWASNSIGTGYGEDKSFTTKDTATVTTTTVTGIYANKAIAGGIVTDDGDTTVTARGVKWGTAANNLDHTVAAAQGGTGAYTVNITGLTGGTTYYVSAYATNSVATAYGDTLSFTTSDTIPVVTTLAPASLVDTGATLNGNVVSDCGSEITARGFRWGRLDETQAHDTAAATAGTGEFSVVLTSLTEQTDYFVIAYATNSTGTAWGDTVKFTTPASGPDYSCVGTKRANEEIDPETGRINKVRDHQNNEYKIVQIGSQCWMAWNMRCTTSPSTTHSIVVSGSTSTKDFSSFTSKVAKDHFPGCDSCGLLYNWNAAMDVYKSGSAEVLSQGAGSQDATTSFQATIGTNHRGICPAGWHVPTPAEWNELESYVGQNYACGNNNTYVAKALAWNEGWSSANLWQTCEPGRDQETTNNATGFSARPQGQFASNYQYQSTYAYFWTTEQRYVSNQWSRAVTRSIFYSNPDLGKGTNTFKYNGNSVRCVRNAEN